MAEEGRNAEEWRLSDEPAASPAIRALRCTSFPATDIDTPCAIQILP